MAILQKIVNILYGPKPDACRFLRVDSGNFKEVEEIKKALKGQEQYVEYIHIHCSNEEHTEAYENLLIFLAKNCPNIKTAVLKGPIGREFYLEEMKHKNWRQLEKIVIKRSNETIALNIELASQHPSALKSLEFSESELETFLSNEKGLVKRTFEEYYAGFRSLETIAITVDRSCYWSDLDLVIPKQSKSLTLNFCRNNDEKHTDFFCDQGEIREYNELKKLTLVMPSYNHGLINNLLKKFPHLEEVTFKETLRKMSKDEEKEFADLLVNKNNFKFKYLSCNKSAPVDFIKILIESSRVKDCKTQYKFAVDIKYDDCLINELRVEKTSSKNKVSYMATLYLRPSCRLDFLKTSGASLTGLSVALLEEDSTRNTLSEEDYIIQYVSEYCPNVEILQIHEPSSVVSKKIFLTELKEWKSIINRRDSGVFVEHEK